MPCIGTDRTAAISNPITRRIPWVGKEHDPTLSGLTNTLNDSAKPIIDPTGSMLNGIFKPLGNLRGAKK